MGRRREVRAGGSRRATPQGGSRQVPQGGSRQAARTRGSRVAGSRHAPGATVGRRRATRRPRPWRPVLAVTLALAILVPTAAWAFTDLRPGARVVTAPRAPSVDETAGTQMRISWRPVAQVAYYEVSLRKAGAEAEPATKVRSEDTALQVSRLDADSTYRVSVRAVAEDGGEVIRSAYSTKVEARTTAPPEPALLVPPGLRLDPTTEETIQVAWDAIDDVSGYEVQYARGKDFKDAASVDVDGTTAELTKLDAGLEYHIRVRANGPDDAHSGWTDALSIESPVPDDAPPLRVASYNVKCHSCGGPSWQTRRGAVASLIDGQSPDVVGLQEAQQSKPRGVGIPQYADLVRVLNTMGPDYAVTEPNPDASKGTRIIYKKDSLVLLDRGVIRFSRQAGRQTDRYAVWAAFRQRSTGREFVFASTHLEPDNRGVSVPQAQQLARTMPGIAKGRPAIVVGDFNMSQFQSFGGHDAMTRAGFVDPLGLQASSKRPSDKATVEKRIRTNYDTFFDFRRRPAMGNRDPQGNGVYIDYIFTTPMRVPEYEMVMNLDGNGSWRGQIPSDHHMIRADVVLPDD